MADSLQTPVLRAEHLRKTYRLPGAEPIRIFEDLSLCVQPGEHVAVLGKSGSGKSTLLNLLGGLDAPDRGADPVPVIEIAGCNLLSASERKRSRIRARDIGFVFQSFHLIPELTIVENVQLASMALPSGGAKGTPPRERAEELLKAAGLGDRLAHRPRELSGGEQQRVAIARALMNAPRLLLADEPTGNLDATTGLQVLDMLFDLAGTFSGERPALVMVTHSEDIARRCDRILRLEGGRLAEGPAR